MANSRTRIWLSSLLNKPQRSQSAAGNGFTLLEILISVAIAGIVVSGLLFLVVELLRIDRRELALETVQRDMQRAMDYITDDLEEAVYIYSTPTDITSQLEDLDKELTDHSAVPVLAFWRVNGIDVANDTTIPANCSGEGVNSTTCEVIKTRRASYTLVVYYQRPQYANWEGQSTIKRYELAQYSGLNAPGGADYTVTAGYRDPANDDGTDFETWTPDGTVTGGTESVLVDYVNGIDTDTTGAISCATLINDSNQQLTGVGVDADDYVLAPTDATDATGFFACINNPEVAAFRTNQDVYVFLQGNAVKSGDNFEEAFNRGSLQPAGDDSILPVLQTQIRLGGVINREGE